MRKTIALTMGIGCLLFAVGCADCGGTEETDATTPRRDAGPSYDSHVNDLGRTDTRRNDTNAMRDTASEQDANTGRDVAPTDAAGATVTTIADLRTLATATTAVDLRLNDVYVTYLRTNAYLVQAIQSGPGIYVYIAPATHSVAIGNKISLHITEVGSYNGMAQVTNATVLANDGGTYNVVTNLRQLLSTGAGVAPAETLESELVGATNVTVVSGSGRTWVIRYGSGPVETELYAYDATNMGICAGATLDIVTGYVSDYNGSYEIAAYYAADFANLHTNGCSAADAGQHDSAVADGATGPDSAVAHDAAAQDATGVQTTTIANLRSQATSATPTSVHVRLDDVYVTYARTVGYFVQAVQNGPGIFVYAAPATHGVAVGNKISLLVNAVADYNGMAEITDSSVATNDGLIANVASTLRQSLSTGAGVAPAEAYESELVGVTGATVTAGSGRNFTISYGSGTTGVALYAYEAATVGLCVGATFNLIAGYVNDSSAVYDFRSYYAADFSNVSITGCSTADNSNWGFESWTQLDPIEDFEYSGTGFTLTRETTQKHGGASSGNVTWTVTSDPDFCTTYKTPVTVGLNYTCAVWVYDNDTAGRVRPFIKWLDSASATINPSSFSTTYSTDQTSWQQLSIQAAAPTNSVTMKCCVRMYDVTAGWDNNATVYVDDLTVTQP